ncbi:MAG TPA: hypothetical protein VK797_25510 [Tepidisphaeraceae bacterium]|jgi:hypothetical protein|nr:hypothetical protein [Tepidisphaeraceae bacterium]
MRRKPRLWHGLPARAWTASLLLLSAAQISPTVYKNDFEQAQVGKVPDDILVLDGTFAVRQVDANKCLELAGDPLGSFAALFGPDGMIGADVSARIQGFPQGKRFPEFGIGAGGPGGYKLFAVPGQHRIELRKGEDVKAFASFDWSPGSWTCFRLRIEPGDKNTWAIKAKAWRQGTTEPEAWMVNAEDPKPPSGKASIWGSDYSEQPIRFDDLSVVSPSPAGRG